MTAVLGRPLRAFGHRRGLWVASYVFSVLMAFTTAPSPLYVVYAQRDHFSALVITVIYAVYSIGVLASLFFVSHRSDVQGRRVHLLAALGLAVVSSILFIVWPSLAGLFVTRVISGFSVGLTVSTATAYLTELHRAERPGSSTARPQLAATVANLGGLAVGALLTGLLAQYVAHPLVVPYVVLMALLVVAGLAVAVTPETRPRRRPPPPYRPQRVSVPADARPQFFAALLGVFFAYAPAALFIGTAGTFLVTAVHNRSLATAGVAVFLFFAAGSAFLALARAWPARRLVAAGLVLDVVGLGLLVLAAWLPAPSLALFLVGGAVAGPAAGALFKGTMASLIEVASADTLGEALAGFFLAGYLGLSIPAVAVGVALQYLSPRLSLLVFAAAIVGGILSVSPVLLARRPATTTRDAAGHDSVPAAGQRAGGDEADAHSHDDAATAGDPLGADLARPGVAAVFGTVRHPATGAPVAGADVTLTDRSGHVVGRTVSGADGAYRFTVREGTYTLAGGDVYLAERTRHRPGRAPV